MAIDFITFDGQEMTFIAPVAEYDALAVFAIDFNVMEIGAVGVAMNQDVCLMFLQNFFDRIRMHVSDGAGFVSLDRKSVV